MPSQFNPDQNPFAAIMGQGGQMQAAPSQGAPSTGAQPKIPGSSQQQAMMQMGPKQLQEGQEGTGSKFLLGAIQNIQSYIQMSTDPRKIQMLRQLVQVFVNMLAQEQQEAADELSNMPEGQEDEYGSSGMMGGMGGGMQ